MCGVAIRSGGSTAQFIIGLIDRREPIMNRLQGLVLVHRVDHPVEQSGSDAEMVTSALSPRVVCESVDFVLRSSVRPAVDSLAVSMAGFP